MGGYYCPPKDIKLWLNDNKLLLKTKDGNFINIGGTGDSGIAPLKNLVIQDIVAEEKNIPEELKPIGNVLMGNIDLEIPSDIEEFKKLIQGLMDNKEFDVLSFANNTYVIPSYMAYTVLANAIKALIDLDGAFKKLQEDVVNLKSNTH